MPPPPSFDARLVGARVLSPSVRELTFERVDGRPMEFAAGQWLNVLIPSGDGVALAPRADSGASTGVGGAVDAPAKRSYSIASAPDGSPRFELAVTRVEEGAVSTWLHELAPGALLPFSGPAGFFTRDALALPPSLMVATGTGVTPMRSMVRAAMAAGATAPTCLLLGVRHEEDLLYDAEFREIARRCPWFRFEATLSRPGDDWGGRRGYVQAHVRALWEALPGSVDGAPLPQAFVCGLQRMVGSVRDLLRKEMGLAREQVHSERYD
jgi:CDP-4-dehydro-6-deoxyglucose reductase